MSERSRRIGENEALYRSVNEKIGDLNDTFGLISETMAVVCECGRLDCTEQITLGISTYEHVRSDPTFFVLLPGHEERDVETVVEEHDGFNVVRKDPGEPAAVARELA